MSDCESSNSQNLDLIQEDFIFLSAGIATNFPEVSTVFQINPNQSSKWISLGYINFSVLDDKIIISMS